MKRPNLVYVFADQLRYQSLGYSGDAKARTPNIDRFAKEGVNFFNATVNYPVCAAYRATLLTGKHVTSHGMVINEMRINPNQRCFGHMLTEAGYKTSYIGKWHLYGDEFGNHEDPRNGFVPRGPHRLGFDGEWRAFGFNHAHYRGYYYTETPHPVSFPEGTYETDGQTHLAVDFLTRAAAEPEQPFALFLSWGPPHAPWGRDNVPERFNSLFEDVSFPNPPNYKPHDDEPYADAWAKARPSDRASLESWRRGYYAQTSCIDDNFGKLLQALDRLNLSDDTIVVFTSDHGEMLGAQGRMAKSIFYEEACRVPLLIRWPLRVPAGNLSDACISAVDLMPTLLSMMEIPVPSEAEGMNLSHCAYGQVGPEPEAAFLQGTGACAIWEDGHEWRGLRDKRYTYAIYRVDGLEFLFDNLTDPWQMTNLADSSQAIETLDNYRGLLQKTMHSFRDDFSASSWYRDHWTDGSRKIICSATSTFQPRVATPDSQTITST